MIYPSKLIESVANYQWSYMFEFEYKKRETLRVCFRCLAYLLYCRLLKMCFLQLLLFESCWAPLTLHLVTIYKQRFLTSPIFVKKKISKQQVVNLTKINKRKEKFAIFPNFYEFPPNIIHSEEKNEQRLYKVFSQK